LPTGRLPLAYRDALRRTADEVIAAELGKAG
jgi:hypothetical protein